MQVHGCGPECTRRSQPRSHTVVPYLLQLLCLYLLLHLLGLEGEAQPMLYLLWLYYGYTYYSTCLVSKARLSSGSRMFATGSHVLCASEYPFHLQPYGREPATVGDGACNRMQ